MTWISWWKKWRLTTVKTKTLTELAILAICTLLFDATDAHILVYKRSTQKVIEEYNDLPAQFGPSLPSNGIKVFAVPARPAQGCDHMYPPDATSYPPSAKFVAVIERGGVNCSFELKVRNAQAVRFDAVIVYNNEGEDLETMSAANQTGIRIPSVFVGHSTGLNLLLFFNDEIVILINDELPFNINTQLILPFSILIGLCFLIMIFYMVYKCIREERRLRRFRLPKSMLKKLKILKYTKSCGITQETCVICIDEFVEGDKVRVLPCNHAYHNHCIDPWLTENRRVCPICKRKVFTKGESRPNRNRQTSLDSVTDTDDDTTPLLQPSANANNNNSNADNNRRRNRRRNRPTRNAANSRAAVASTTNAATNTRHGTFQSVTSEENSTSAVSVDAMSDDENVLLAQQSPVNNTRRTNPFDRPTNFNADQLNTANQRSIWSLPIFRIFQRQQPISIAAPPFDEEYFYGNVETVDQPQLASAPTPMPNPTSNNILNPNLSGSFKDDEEMPHVSIYEPIATNLTPTVERNTEESNLVTQDGDSVFIQTPVQGGIGVVALPNTAFISDPNSIQGSGSGSTRPNISRFHI